MTALNSERRRRSPPTKRVMPAARIRAMTSRNLGKQKAPLAGRRAAARASPPSLSTGGAVDGQKSALFEANERRFARFFYLFERPKKRSGGGWRRSLERN